MELHLKMQKSQFHPFGIFRYPSGDESEMGVGQIGFRIGMIGTILALGLTAGVLSRQPASDTRTETPPVRARIIAGADTVAPGATFPVGFHFRLASDWHIYWQNPGESGLATTLTFKLPAGFRLGAIHMPTPKKFIQPGDIIGYGYEGEVVIWADITSPATLSAPGPFTIEARATWLACHNMCVLGEQNDQVQVSVAARTNRINRKLFDHWRLRLPVPADQDPVLVSATVSGGPLQGGQAVPFQIDLAWRKPPVQFDWIPGPSLDIQADNIRRTSHNGHTRATFTLTLLKGLPVPDHLDSLVVYIRPDGTRGGIRVPLSFDSGQSKRRGKTP